MMNLFYLLGFPLSFQTHSKVHSVGPKPSSAPVQPVDLYDSEKVPAIIGLGLMLRNENTLWHPHRNEGKRNQKLQ